MLILLTSCQLFAKREQTPEYVVTDSLEDVISLHPITISEIDTLAESTVLTEERAIEIASIHAELHRSTSVNQFGEAGITVIDLASTRYIERDDSINKPVWLVTFYTYTYAEFINSPPEGQTAEEYLAELRANPLIRPYFCCSISGIQTDRNGDTVFVRYHSLEMFLTYMIDAFTGELICAERVDMCINDREENNGDFIIDLSIFGKSLVPVDLMPKPNTMQIMIEDFTVTDITIPQGVSQELHFGNEPVADDTEIIWSFNKPGIIDHTPSDDSGRSVIITGKSIGWTEVTVKVGNQEATCIVRVR